jgi:hypothetical protein
MTTIGFVNKRVKVSNFSKEDQQMALVMCHCLKTCNDLITFCIGIYHSVFILSSFWSKALKNKDELQFFLVVREKLKEAK